MLLQKSLCSLTWAGSEETFTAIFKTWLSVNAIYRELYLRWHTPDTQTRSLRNQKHSTKNESPPVLSTRRPHSHLIAATVKAKSSKAEQSSTILDRVNFLSSTRHRYRYTKSFGARLDDVTILCSAESLSPLRKFEELYYSSLRHSKLNQARPVHQRLYLIHQTYGGYVTILW